jgi:hypothetical protein
LKDADASSVPLLLLCDDKVQKKTTRQNSLLNLNRATKKLPVGRNSQREKGIEQRTGNIS